MTETDEERCNACQWIKERRRALRKLRSQRKRERTMSEYNINFDAWLADQDPWVQGVAQSNATNEAMRRAYYAGKARYVALVAALRDDGLADCAQKARSCIGLLNSMVRGGETHSETSCRMLVEALEALDAIAVYRAWLLALVDEGDEHGNRAGREA